MWGENFFPSTVLKNGADPEDVHQGKESWQGSDWEGKGKGEEKEMRRAGLLGPRDQQHAYILPASRSAESETLEGKAQESFTSPPGDLIFKNDAQ